jgi:hypothetical protein
MPQPVLTIVACKTHHLTLSHAPITWGHVDNPAGRVKFAPPRTADARSS